ncbi:MAG: RDD family protein [Chloroflexi bacterium]|nr:RDD family protein [Chloroflexota bacterium]MDA1147469.1 RDD family protein [Chloroflexota bacterium]
MFCIHCGTEANNEDRFCRSCGRELTAPPPEGNAERGPIPAGGQPGPSWSGQPRAVAPSMAAGQPGRTAGRLLGDGPAELAPNGRRISAFLIDIGFAAGSWFAIAVIFAIGYFAVNGIPENGNIPIADQDRLGLWMWLSWILIMLVGTWVANATGGTVGKRILGLRIVRTNLEPPGIGWGLGRTLTAWLSWIPVGLGFLWGTWDDSGQTWHDKMSGTYVVRVDSLPVRPVPAAEPSSLH